MHPDTLLGIHLSTICSRNQYTRDPGPVLDELRTVAGDRTDILTREIGTWVGYYEDEHTIILTTALRTLPGLEPWIQLGQQRRGAPRHSTH